MILLIILIGMILSFCRFKEKFTKSAKFFNECGKDSPLAHMDHRFCDKNHNNPLKTLIPMYKSFMNLAIKHGIKPVLFFGGLLGWHFNKKFLPWDDDVDLVFIGKDIDKFKKLDGYENDLFFIEVNPNSKNRSKKDYNNIIDARVISKKNGLFIDIFFMTPNGDNSSIYSDKTTVNDQHLSNLIPIKKGIFEEFEVFLPNNVTECLKSRYGPGVTSYDKHGPPGDRYSWSFVNGKWSKA